jgi:excisionase family DNA binding protein
MFTVKQAAQRLGVSAQLVYNLCTARKLEHVRVGLGRGKILIPEPALNEYLRGQTVGVAGPAPIPRPVPALKHLSLS